MLPLGSASQSPATTSFPDFLQTVAVVMSFGMVKSIYFGFSMKDVVSRGTGASVNFGNMAIAGKTGTTTNNRDALFAGFTPHGKIHIFQIFMDAAHGGFRTDLGFSYLKDFGFTTLVDEDNVQSLALGGLTK